MSLQQQVSEAGLRVRWVRADAIGIEHDSIDENFLLSPQRIYRPFAAGGLAALDEGALLQVIELAPDLLLLGTGQRQRFLPPRLQAVLLSRGIGVECMDNAAAARTFNLLADENRHLLAAFLFDHVAAPERDR